MFLLQRVSVYLKQCGREVCDFLFMPFFAVIPFIVSVIPRKNSVIPGKNIVIPSKKPVIPSAAEESYYPGIQDSSAALGMTELISEMTEVSI